MIITAICDDEPEFLQAMAEVLKTMYPDEIKSTDIYTSPKKLLENDRIYDMVFLDIDIPEMNGLELSNHFSSDTAVVFVTNHEALVFKAYNATDSFGFIRKSKLKDDLQSVMKRFMKIRALQQTIPVKVNEQLLQIRCSSILYIEKQVNSVIIHTPTDSYTVRKTLSEIERQLVPSGFIRTHIGYLVNPDKIRLIEKNCVILQNGTPVPVSRSRRKEVCSEFLKRSVLTDD